MPYFALIIMFYHVKIACYQGVITAHIKTDETYLERPIKIKRQAFDALLITHATWRNLDGSSAIQRPRLN